MNNYQINYLYSLQLNYKKLVKKYKYKFPRSKLVKIIAGIETIERENRFFLWRFIEYLILMYSWTMHYFLGKPLINYSIGKYQLKINLILNYKYIDYKMNKKEIIMPYKISFRLLWELIFLSNNYHCMENVLKSKFDFKWTQLIDEQIEEVALFYSRNIKFEGCFNYFSILKTLYNQECSAFEEASNFS